MDADRTERQRDVVDDDENVFQRNFLGLHPVTDGFPAQVHVGRRLEQDECPSFVFQFRYRAVALGAKNSIGRFC